MSLQGQDSLYSLDDTTYVTWEEAGALCRADGAHLVVIDSQEELDAVMQLRSDKGIDSFLSWAGFHDRFVEGEYITVLGINNVFLSSSNSSSSSSSSSSNLVR